QPDPGGRRLGSGLLARQGGLVGDGGRRALRRGLERQRRRFDRGRIDGGGGFRRAPLFFEALEHGLQVRGQRRRRGREQLARVEHFGASPEEGSGADGAPQR